MSKLVNAIVDTYTNGTELYITNDNLDKFATADGWQFVTPYSSTRSATKARDSRLILDSTPV